MSSTTAWTLPQIYGIYFDHDRADVKPESKPTLSEIATLLKQNATMNLIVVGHTDNNGTLEYNLDLSLRRAQAVAYGENIRHAESHGVPAEFLDCLKRVYAAGGRRGVVQWVLDTQTDNLPAFQRVLLHGELGNLDEAIRHLELAIDAHEPCLVEIGVAPQWDPLRADPRFQQCLVRMGLNAQAARISDRSC